MAFKFFFTATGIGGVTTVTATSGTTELAVGDLVVGIGTLENDNDRALTFTLGGTATTSGVTEVANLDRFSNTDFYNQEVFWTRVTGAGTLTVQPFSTTGGASIPNVDSSANGNGVFNKWQYSPNLGGIFYIGNYNAGIWFLRLH